MAVVWDLKFIRGWEEEAGWAGEAAAGHPGPLPCAPSAAAACRALSRGIPAGSTIAIDVGAHNRTEFLNWLQADPDGRRWVIALEPNPELSALQPPHSRLAVLEVAAGKPDGSGRSVLHRSNLDGCNSLLPLSPVPRKEMVTSISALRACLEPADTEPLEVQVVPLASVFRLLGEGQEVALLKIDAQGGDLDAVLSAGSYLRFVRRLQVEVHDFPSRHPLMPYVGQPCKEEVVLALQERGFVLEACRPVSPDFREEDCLFSRADIILREDRLTSDDLVWGEIRWDRPVPWS